MVRFGLPASSVQSYGGGSVHETLFHYYLWPWLHLFGYNILTDEAAGLALWCTTFLFTLLLADQFFESYVVTSVIALVLLFCRLRSFIVSSRSTTKWRSRYAWPRFIFCI